MKILIVPALVFVSLPSCRKFDDISRQVSKPAPILDSGRQAVAAPGFPVAIPEPRPDGADAALVRTMSQKLSPTYQLASDQFGEFLRTHGCVGRPLNDVRKQLGKPDRETKDSIGYIFENGRSGQQWVLHHDGERITSITTVGVN